MELVFLDFDSIKLLLELLILLMDTLFSLVAVPLQSLVLHDFRLDRVQLHCKLLSELFCLKLLLFGALNS